MILEKRDFTVSMARANVVVVFLTIPLLVAQLRLFLLFHAPERLMITWNFALFVGLVAVGVLVHELCHGLGWMVFGKKPLRSVSLGFQWKTLTPFAHLSEPVEIDAYRIGTLLPGLIVGVLPYVLSLVLGDGNLLWLGIMHTTAAGGDWLVLWLLRGLKPGLLVEDHPTSAGCFVMESPVRE
jgi:hypothetical protein